MEKRTIKRKFTCTLLALTLVILAAGCSDEKSSNPFSSWDTTYGEDMERRVDAEGISGLDVSTTNGSIEVEGFAGIRMNGGGGDQVCVYARKEITAPSVAEAEEFAERVVIRTVREGTIIRVYSDYPEPPSDIQVAVSFEIESPREVDLNLHTVNGTVRAEGMIGSVQATTANGNVVADVVELTGNSLFSTVNGAVDLKIRGGIAPLTGTTVNGGVTLTLHSGFGGRLDARSGNGGISCNFPIHDTGFNTPNHLTGTIGSGGSTPVTLRTANGSIYLDRF